MSTGNITKYHNDSLVNDIKTNLSEFSFLQTFFLALCVISSVILISLAVYLVVRKRSLDELRHRLVPLYHFDPAECEDWEDELLEDSKKEGTRNTIQFYRSMSTPVVKMQP